METNYVKIKKVNNKTIYEISFNSVEDFDDEFYGRVIDFMRRSGNAYIVSNGQLTI